MSDEQKRPSADTNCRGVDGDVGQGKGKKMQRVKRGREKLLGGEVVVSSERIERGGGAEWGDDEKDGGGEERGSRSLLIKGERLLAEVAGVGGAGVWRGVCGGAAENRVSEKRRETGSGDRREERGEGREPQFNEAQSRCRL